MCRYVQYKWESQQSNAYTIKEDNTEPLEGSGTRIVLHLKEDSEEYLDDFKVSPITPHRTRPFGSATADNGAYYAAVAVMCSVD